MTKNKPKKITTLKELIAEVNKNFEMIDKFIQVQNKFNKDQMNELKRMFNYMVELDGIIKDKLK